MSVLFVAFVFLSFFFLKKMPEVAIPIRNGHSFPRNPELCVERCSESTTEPRTRRLRPAVGFVLA